MAADARPEVTVIVPVLDEAPRIAGCIDAIALQDMPPARVEVLVVDGGYTDDTVQVAEAALRLRGFANAQVLYSADGSRSGNLNTGLAAAQAPVVCRVDARSRIPSHYLRACRELLSMRADIAVAG